MYKERDIAEQEGSFASQAHEKGRSGSFRSDTHNASVKHSAEDGELLS